MDNTDNRPTVLPGQLATWNGTEVYDGDSIPIRISKAHRFVCVQYRAGGIAGVVSVGDKADLAAFLEGEASTNPDGSTPTDLELAEIALQADAQLHWGVPFVFVYGCGSADTAVALVERWDTIKGVLPVSNYGWQYAGEVE